MILGHTSPKHSNRSKRSDFTILYEISQILEESLDINRIIQRVLQFIAEHLGMIRGAITLLDRNTGEILIEEAYGLSSRQRERGRYRVGEGITGKVVETGDARIIPCVFQDPAFLNRTRAREQDQGENISFICVPVKLKNQVIGTLSVDHILGDQCDLEEDARLLTIIASLSAQAISIRRDIMEEKRQLQAENSRLQQQLRDRFRPSNIIGTSAAMQMTYDMIAQVARSSTTVLIRGESGTGKELAAQAIHYTSNRSNKQFIKVNCAALPEAIIESELFGHEKGAFTGAVNMRKGRFELADGGSIFLDEIGDLSPLLQVKLLRILQEREFERVGSSYAQKIDVRVIAATNRNLEQLIQKGDFREDLYYRLNVFPIQLPPLRDRRSDIMLLADYFIDRYAAINNLTIHRISTPAINLLTNYHWPGNIRELENSIERAVLLSNDGVIHSHHLPPSLQSAESTNTAQSGSLTGALEAFEKEMIIEALKLARGNRSRAAASLQITERIMGLRIQKYGIDTGKYR